MLNTDIDKKASQYSIMNPRKGKYRKAHAACRKDIQHFLKVKKGFILWWVNKMSLKNKSFKWTYGVDRSKRVTFRI